MPAHREEQDLRAARLKSVASLLLLDSHVSPHPTETQLVALLLAHNARNLNKQTLRGPYNAVKSDDFFLKLVYEFGDRAFKSFLRCVSTINIIISLIESILW